MICKTATVAENSEKTVTVALFCDSRRFLRQSHLKPVHTVAEKCDKSATICRRKVRLSQNAEFGDCRRCLAVFCDSREIGGSVDRLLAFRDC